MSHYSSTPAPDAAAEAESKWLTEALLGRSDCDIFRQLDGLRRYIRSVGVTPSFRSPPIGCDVPCAPIDGSSSRFGPPARFRTAHGFVPRHRVRVTSIFHMIGPLIKIFGICRSDSDGFARYILEHTPARGVAIVPPAAEGGTGWAIPPSDRFEFHELDVTRYLQSDPTSRALPFSRTSFDFIILDADYSCPRTLVAHLLLALCCLVEGGTILLHLPCIERPLTARVTIALSSIFDDIHTYKPAYKAWNHRFYMHGQTVRHHSAYRRLKHNLERLWSRIQTVNTPNCTWVEEDLITPWEEVLQTSNIDWIVTLGNPVWGTQLKALHGAFGIECK
ncbi:unnamed protein product [Rhizoctonia solani]|uniref:Uncharacterized protein n=1 Tax=Rhizoctonia solani TaxID=456999 RepID=A0A8H3C3E2_9AGAM|nr:unnamed protein product [Rhizoctonia solani]